jgi:hypothetical protein
MVSPTKLEYFLGVSKSLEHWNEGMRFFFWEWGGSLCNIGFIIYELNNEHFDIYIVANFMLQI